MYGGGKWGSNTSGDHGIQGSPACTGDEPEGRDRAANLHAVTYGRTIITSVDLMRAAATWPCFSRNSRTASAVMMEVMRCSPMDSVTCAIRPLVLISTTLPIS